MKKYKCANCKSEVIKLPSQVARSKSGNVFCNRSCSTSFNNQFKTGTNHPNYKNGATASRKRVFEERGYVCEKCGYCKIPEILQVHHKDRNRQNNENSNLLILCPNCHQEDHFLAKDGRYFLTG